MGGLWRGQIGLCCGSPFQRKAFAFAPMVRWRSLGGLLPAWHMAVETLHPLLSARFKSFLSGPVSVNQGEASAGRWFIPFCFCSLLESVCVAHKLLPLWL